jgi:hypothetical protein
LADTGKVRALGPPRTDFDGDGLVEAPYVSAGGDLKPIDGDPGVVYLGNDDGMLRYLDGVTAHVTSGAEMERRFLTDDTGSRIDGSEIPGLTS